METDRHHVWWPKRELKAPIEKRVRNMGAFVIEADKNSHRELHRNMPPPPRLEKCELYDLYIFMQERNEVVGLAGLEWAIAWANSRKDIELEEHLLEQLEFLDN